MRELYIRCRRRDGSVQLKGPVGGGAAYAATLAGQLQQDPAIRSADVVLVSPLGDQDQAPAVLPAALPAQLPALLTVRQVAALLTLSVRTVWRLAGNGVLPPPLRLANHVTRWRRVDLEQYVAGVQETAGLPA